MKLSIKVSPLVEAKPCSVFFKNYSTQRFYQHVNIMFFRPHKCQVHFLFLDLVPNVMTIAFQMFYFCMKNMILGDFNTTLIIIKYCQRFLAWKTYLPQNVFVLVSLCCCFIHGAIFYFNTRWNNFMLKLTFPRSRCSSKGEDITEGGFSFIQMIEQTKICSMLDIPKNYECNLKVKNLGFDHKTNAHANCTRNVTSNMGYMKEFPNNTTIVCSINKRNQHVGSKQQARLYWNQIGDVIIKTEIEQTFKIVPLMREKHTKGGVENFYTQISCK